MFRIALCCQILFLFFVGGTANSSIKGQCRAGVCDDRPTCPQSPCRCLYPSRVDCTLYYQCVQGKPLQYRCSPGLLFNEETLTCDYDFNVNCSIRKTTKKTELSTVAVTTVTTKISEMPVITDNDAISDNSNRSTEPSTQTSNDATTVNFTKIYQSSTSNEMNPTETTVSKFSDLTTEITTNTTLTEINSESYSKSESTDDITATDSSLKSSKISIPSTYSSFDILLNTTYSKSSDFLTKTTNPTFTPRQNTEYTSTTKENESTSPISISDESEKPERTSFSFTTKDIAVSETTISISTTKQSEEPETTISRSTTKQSEEPETTVSRYTTKQSEEPETTSRFTTKRSEEPETTISRSTTKQSEEPETTTFTLTTKENEEPKTIIFKSTVKESKELETTRLTSLANQSEEFETSNFRSPITTTSKPTVAIGSTGGTETQPDVTEDLQVHNWTCPFRFGLFPDESDCNKFYHCSHWTAYRKACPSNLHFNSELMVCDWPEDAGCHVETTDSVKYQSTTPSPNSAEIVKDSSTKITLITYTDNESSKLSSPPTNETTSTATSASETSAKHTKVTSEPSFSFHPVTTSTKSDLSPSSISATYGETTTLKDPSTDQKTESEDGEITTILPPTTNADFSQTSESNENYTTKRFVSTTASLPSESIPISSNHDFVSILSTKLSTPVDAFSTETRLQDSSTKETTTELNPTAEITEATKFRENSSTPTGPNSSQTASLISDVTTEDLTDFTNATTKRLVTILSSTDGSSTFAELNESSTSNVSKITEGYQNFTTANDSDVKISTTEPDSNSSFICPSRFGLFPDPENCFRFYHCSHWVKVHKWCPSGLHFNPKLQVCDWPDRAGCGESPIIPTSEIIQPDEDDTIFNQTCDCECCFYPDKTDCSRYALCLDGHLHIGRCTEGLLFNHLDNNCDIGERVTCTQKSSSCASQNGIFSHPTLCTAFYRCVNGHPFLEYCSENEHFKSSERKCVDPCDAKCDKTLSCNTPHPPSGASSSPICIENEGLYPSESDCSSYYLCTEGSAYLVKCPDGLHFNVEYGVCEPPCDARCDPTVDCPDSPIQLSYSKSFENLPLRCPRPNGLFPIEGECGAYNLCSKGRAHLLHCPPGFHYSSENETCETPCSAQCDKNIDCASSNDGKSKRSLLPSIHLPLLLLCKTLNNGTLPNSENCSSFYKCSKGQVHLVPCAKGLHFDPEDETCKDPCLAGCEPNIQCPLEIPTPKGKCSCENCYLQDPTDCSAYLYCGHGLLTKGYCPRGMLFDRSSNKCRNASEVACEAIGDTAMCEQPFGNFSHPGNCRKFIQCKDSVAHVKDCEDELEFDPAIRECANPTRHCEQIRKDPFCEETTGYLAHPRNSSLFYHCENGFKYLKSCSSPLVYNALDQVCDWPHNVQDGSRKKVLKTKDIQHEIIENSSASPSHENLSGSGNSTCQVVPGVVCPCACRVTTYDDCQSFYHCLKDGNACEKRCPEGLYFNRKTMVCDLPQNVECRDFFFATLRRLKSRKSNQTSIKFPLETAYSSPDPEFLL